MSATDQDVDYVARALPAFVTEAREQIERFEQLMLELEAAPDDVELLDALFRCAHTVKGSAGIFGLDRVVAFTHHVETLLDELREGRVRLTPPLGTLLLKCNDRIRALVELASDPAAETPEESAAAEVLVARLREAAGLANGAAPAAGSSVASNASAIGTQRDAGVRRWHVSVAFGADTFRNGMDPLAILNYVRGIGAVENVVCDADAIPPLDALDAEQCHLAFAFDLDTASGRDAIEGAFSFVRDDCRLEITEPREPAEDTRTLGEMLTDGGEAAGEARSSTVEKQPKQRDGAARGGDENRFIRVHADRLDAVINLLGELVVAGAGAQLLARQSKQRNLVEANLQIGRLIEEIRNGTLQLRMVPIGETFARFRRTVRDTAAELGKDVALEITGGETELDKSVVERIADPLMHLVRNGLDHGLETPQARVAAGKPAQGRLQLAAYHESGSIVIRITDDGAGIRRDKVLARAWERGLVERGVTPPDDAILKLIFEPGFSTADKVTNLSGRGVGMDVVRRNIEALRGSVELESTEGKGTTFEIRLPLTLAIIDGFLVAAGASKFVFPLESVVEVIENRRGISAPDSRGRMVGEIRGGTLPILDLRTFYGLDGPTAERSSIVVIRAGHRRYGVVVDALLGQHQTVIKPLGRMFRSLRGMSGSSILGNGEVALIFDVNALADLASAAPSRTHRTPGESS